MQLKKDFLTVRKRTEDICAPLKTEDYVVQPVVDVSPPKWHLGHTTWFFETFILIPNAKGYTEFDPQYNFVFNSYLQLSTAPTGAPRVPGVCVQHCLLVM